MRDIFLCHTGSDKDWVEELAKRLEAETVENRPISVWFDKWDIDGGENILQKIEEGLKNTRFLAVVLSPAMTRADWPKLEWQSQVYEDPAGRKARILPILRHQVDPVTGEPIEIPLPLRILKRYNFTSHNRFEPELRELVRRIRGIPHPRGGGHTASAPTFIGQEEPTGGEESLLSNLLPTVSLPNKLWSDETTVIDPAEVIEKTKPHTPFWIGDGQLHSFWSPEAPRNPFKSVLTGRLRKVHRTSDWLADPVTSPRIVQMFNRALRTHCFKLRMNASEKDRELFFCPVNGTQTRKFAWGATGRARTLAKLVQTKDGSSFGVHYATRLRFVVLGATPYLLIQPGWYFTRDGSKPLEGAVMGALSTQWGGRERNAAVLRNVLMWGLFLANRQPAIELHLGSERLRIGAVPAHSRIGVSMSEDTVRLDRILGGAEHAGEIGEAVASDEDEIDQIAKLQEAGAFELIAESFKLEGDGDEEEQEG